MLAVVFADAKSTVFTGTYTLLSVVVPSPESKFTATTEGTLSEDGVEGYRLQPTNDTMLKQNSTHRDTSPKHKEHLYPSAICHLP